MTCKRIGHDVRLVETRLTTPYLLKAPVRVELVYRCDTWGCPVRLMEWTEQARDPEDALRTTLTPRGMIIETTEGPALSEPLPYTDAKILPLGPPSSASLDERPYL